MIPLRLDSYWDDDFAPLRLCEKISFFGSSLIRIEIQFKYLPIIIIVKTKEPRFLKALYIIYFLINESLPSHDTLAVANFHHPQSIPTYLHDSEFR